MDGDICTAKAIRYIEGEPHEYIDDALTEELERAIQPVIDEQRQRMEERKRMRQEAKQAFYVSEDMAHVLFQLNSQERKLGKRGRQTVALVNCGPYQYRPVYDRYDFIHITVVREMTRVGLLDAFEIEPGHVGRLRLTQVGRHLGCWMMEQHKTSAYFTREPDGSYTVEPSSYVTLYVRSGTREAEFSVCLKTEKCSLTDYRSKWAQSLDDLKLDALLKACAQNGWPVALDEDAG